MSLSRRFSMGCALAVLVLLALSTATPLGAATYRDVWLEKGFSEFSAALAVQHTQG